MAQIKAGLAVIEALRAEGVEYIFGVCGSTTNSIVTELYGRKDIRFLDTRHEEGAAFMAYGYARASRKPTVCLATSDPPPINLPPETRPPTKAAPPEPPIPADGDPDFLDPD